jgi:hypothetical protein
LNVPGLTSVFEKLDVGQDPALVEIGLRRAIEPEISEPALVRDRLDPVRFGLALGRRRTEVQVDGAVRVLDDVVARRAVGIGAGFDEAARLVVVDGERPELRDRRILRNMQCAGLAAVEPISSISKAAPASGRWASRRGGPVGCPAPSRVMGSYFGPTDPRRQQGRDVGIVATCAEKQKAAPSGGVLIVLSNHIFGMVAGARIVAVAVSGRDRRRAGSARSLLC